MNTARLPRTFIGARNPIAPLRYTATAMTNPAPNVEDDLRGDHALRVPRRQVENTRKSVRSRNLCSQAEEILDVGGVVGAVGKADRRQKALRGVASLNSYSNVGTCADSRWAERRVLQAKMPSVPSAPKAMLGLG